MKQCNIILHFNWDALNIVHEVSRYSVKQLAYNYKVYYNHCMDFKQSLFIKRNKPDCFDIRKMEKKLNDIVKIEYNIENIDFNKCDNYDYAYLIIIYKYIHEFLFNYNGNLDIDLICRCCRTHVHFKLVEKKVI